jgi:serine phosphatase RsbU (regulator of sigma subunit)
VFEQKLGEVVNYQRLSQSIQTEKSEDKVYEILLDSAISTVFADAGWIEISLNGQSNKDQENKVPGYSPHQENLIYFKYGIDDSNIAEIKGILKKNKIQGVFNFNSTDRAVNYSKFLTSLKHNNFKSILAFPLTVQDETIGALILLKDVSEGFNREMAEITHTFVNQAGISIENFRLLTSALENERYQEELKIAKKVQNSLLPDLLDSNEDFDIVAFSRAADEVGGDYYDTYRVDENKIALIIGDVSGKGTSAAFNMSQMKGVFHGLSQIKLPTIEFLSYANTALSSCLEKTSFITASYFIIDKAKRRVKFARAGHCPTLYFNRKEKKATFFESRGLGLGILRDENYPDYLEESSVNYEKGDIMVIYTDGITEAKNYKKEEFGYDQLRLSLEKNFNKSAQEISNTIIKEVFAFAGDEDLNDDYTLLILKFK